MTYWTESRVPFHFRLTELNLLRVHRTLAVHRFRFGTECAVESSPKETFEKMGASLDGVLLRSMEIGEPLRSLGFSDGLIRYVRQPYRRYYVDLTLAPEEYAAKFSSKSRSTLRRKVKKLAKANGGEVDLREYKTSSEMVEFYEFAREVSRETYQERLLDAGLPDSLSFRSDMLRAAARGEVRGYLIFLRGKPIAYLYCPVVNDVLEYAYLGFIPDRDIAALSPGTVLLWLVLQKLQREAKFHLFDFTEGADRRKMGQKGFFATGSKLCADVYYLRPTPGNLILATLHLGFDRGVEGLGDLFEWLGIRTRVRKWLRRAADGA